MADGVRGCWSKSSASSSDGKAEAVSVPEQSMKLSLRLRGTSTRRSTNRKQPIILPDLLRSPIRESVAVYKAVLGG